MTDLLQLLSLKFKILQTQKKISRLSQMTDRGSEEISRIEAHRAKLVHLVRRYRSGGDTARAILSEQFNAVLGQEVQLTRQLMDLDYQERLTLTRELSQLRRQLEEQITSLPDMEQEYASSLLSSAALFPDSVLDDERDGEAPAVLGELLDKIVGKLQERDAGKASRPPGHVSPEDIFAILARCSPLRHYTFNSGPGQKSQDAKPASAEPTASPSAENQQQQQTAAAAAVGG